MTIMKEIERLQKILVEWIIDEEIDINTIPSLRLRALVEERRGFIAATQHFNILQTENKTKAEQSVSRLSDLKKIPNDSATDEKHREVKNFKTTMLDFLDDIESTSEAHKSSTMQKLRLIKPFKGM